MSIGVAWADDSFADSSFAVGSWNRWEGVAEDTSSWIEVSEDDTVWAAATEDTTTWTES